MYLLNQNVNIIYPKINNELKEFPKNIIFGKNVNRINLTGNEKIKLKYYNTHFSKIYNILHKLDYNLIFEKIISMHCYLIDIDNLYQTPHICLTKTLDNSDKKYININLPKSFLSMTSWI